MLMFQRKVRYITPRSLDFNSRRTWYYIRNAWNHVG